MFYAIDSARFSHLEYWWGNRSPIVLVAWLLKWLRIRIHGSTDDPNVESTHPFIVDALPDDVMARFSTPAAELARLGFVDPVYHRIEDSGTSTNIYWATYRHVSGQHFARIHQRFWQAGKNPDRGVFILFFTPLVDGTFIAASSGKPDTEAPCTIHMLRKPKASADALWTAHLENAARQHVSIRPVLDREGLIAAGEQFHVLLRDFHLQRGVFRPRTAREQEMADAYTSVATRARTEGLQHPEVLAELEKLQTERPGWGNAIFILVISIVAFMAAGTTMDWKMTLWLIPVLLFHEAGHWVAMKAFGYRNLRMFFIPLIGAAVVGQNRRVPGWKKALVSLAGPVPGIALGTALAIAAFITGHEWLTNAALLLLFINGFNLLPILPLDGGHVLHSTLFCRTWWLDIAFRVVAIAALLALSMMGLGKFFLYIAIAMGVGLPLAFKMSKVTDAMRRATLPPPLDTETNIPPSTAELIIDAVKKQLPAKISHKAVAQQTLQIYETLNARPPGVFGTLGLLTVHAGSVVLVALCGFLLVLHQHGGGLGNFARAAIDQPQHPLGCGSVDRWPGATGASSGPQNTLVVTCEDGKAAKTAFQRIRRDLETPATLTCAGDTLFLSLPASDEKGREHWFTMLQALSTNVFVLTTNQPGVVSFAFVAPSKDVATILESELRGFLVTSQFGNLTAPWDPATARAEFEPIRQARRFWRELDERIGSTWTNTAGKMLNSRIASARRRGATAEVERFMKEQQGIYLKLRDETYEQARARATAPERDLVDLHAQYSQLSFTNRAERLALGQKIAARLGTPGNTGAAHPNCGARGGFVTRSGLLVSLRYLQFDDAPAGMVAMADWLCQKGCTALKYDIMGGGLGYEGEE